MPTKSPAASRTMRPSPARIVLGGRCPAGRPAAALEFGQQRRAIESLCIIGESPATTSTGPVVAGQLLAAHHHGVAGAELLGLHGERDARRARPAPAARRRPDSRRRRPSASTPAAPQRVEHVIDHRPAADRHQHLGQLGLHPGALAGRQDDRKRASSSVEYRQGTLTGRKQPSSHVSRAAFQGSESRSLSETGSVGRWQVV